MDNKIERLIQAYSELSKHSNYQILPSGLEDKIGKASLNVKSRHEKERWGYILEGVDFRDEMVADIGGNTGYFTFECINSGARHVDYFDGNVAHAEFVKLAAELLGLQRRVSVYGRYFDFSSGCEKYDTIILLNVLHHVGDDYGSKDISIDRAKTLILEQLNGLARQTKTLIFQLGFNWKGDAKSCLFEHGTKSEMINYITDGTKGHWDITRIGVAQKIGEDVGYHDLNDQNIARNDSLGEFLNRPIFIMRSKL